jgi:hypothetical integral membrane protein (TIGR02206 family)
MPEWRWRSSYWSPEVPLTAERFQAGGAQHYALLVLFLLGAVGIVLLGRRQRGSDAARRTSRVLAVAIPCVTIPSQIYQLTPGAFDLGTSLPLALCDLAWMTAVWGLWTHRRLPVSLTYFWGLTLSIQGILTPSLGQVLPDPRFFAFWCLHFLVVWSALYLTLGLGIGPTWRTYRSTVVVTTVWAVVVGVFDAVVGMNYGYLLHKPGSGSLLDLFGPWPLYVLVSLGILVAGWAVLTWPWSRRR